MNPQAFLKNAYNGDDGRRTEDQEQCQSDSMDSQELLQYFVSMPDPPSPPVPDEPPSPPVPDEPPPPPPPPLSELPPPSTADDAADRPAMCRVKTEPSSFDYSYEYESTYESEDDEEKAMGDKDGEEAAMSKESGGPVFFSNLVTM